MKVIVDTSILIDHLRGGKKLQEFKENTPDTTELYISSITIYEIYSGQSTKSEAAVKVIEEILKYVTVLDIDTKISKIAGELRRDIGKSISPADYLIAATSINRGASVLTLNIKDFQQIPQLTLYTFN